MGQAATAGGRFTAFVAGLTAALAAALGIAVPAQGASGTWERAWGEDVVQTGMTGDTGIGFEICTISAACQAGAATPPALGGELFGPQGAATDSAGNVYVTDLAHNRVQKFNSSGVFERAWGEDVASAGPGDTGTGFEVCVAANGDTCKIGVTTPPALGGEMNNPPGVATDVAGNVYVADRFHHRVQKFSSSGAFERAWGEDVASAGPGDTGTGFEVCVAANGDTCKIGVTTPPALGGEMNNPFGVATDPAGNVYVGDLGHNRVQKFNSTGVFERAWGEDVVSAGPGDTGIGFEICVTARGDTCKTGVAAGAALGGELSNPAGVAADPAGNVYVGDPSHNRVQKFSSSGAFERAWGEDVINGGGIGFEVCVAASADSCKIGVVAGAALGGEMNTPAGISTDGAANVYLADVMHNRVQKFNSSGAFERAWGEDVASAGPGDTGTGFEVCVAANGDTCKTGVVAGAALGGEMNQPFGLAANAAGDVYVADSLHMRIQKFADPVIPPVAPPAGGGGGAGTGQRAAALKKCKKKKRGKKRVNCIKRAKKRPV